jgi:hypothetical protein
MRKYRFDFNFAPLTFTHSLMVSGSVPAQQTYNADEDEYVPDYKVTPLVLLPQVGIIDPDGVLLSGNVNGQLTNIQWTEYTGGSKQVISSTNTDYTLTTAGQDAGKLIVRRNAKEQSPITLEFSAEYHDSRTGQVTTIVEHILVSCKSATTIPTLRLTAAETSVYNPLRDSNKQQVKATLYLEKKVCPTENRLFVWEVMRDGAWATLGEHNLDYFGTVSSDTTTLTLDKELMGAGVSIRCRARYSNAGAPATVELSEASPQCIINFVRRLPTLDYDIVNVPENLPNGQMYIYPRVAVRDACGILTDPSAVLTPIWYAATNKASGTLAYTEVARGYEPTLSTSCLHATYGAVISVDLEDAGPWMVWLDSDGKALTDQDGKVLLFK